MNTNTIVVVIAGPSGSGKSWLARQMRDELGVWFKVAMLAEDAYYRPQGQLTAQQREATNYDHPDAIEEWLLVDHLRELKSGRAVESPVYDYRVHDRSEEVVSIGPCQILIVEGILLLHREAVREIADFSVFVDVPESICRKRRIDRDMRYRARSRESVIEQYHQTVQPMLKAFVEPSKQFADEIYRSVSGNEEAIEVLLKRVHSVVTEKR